MAADAERGAWDTLSMSVEVIGLMMQVVPRVSKARGRTPARRLKNEVEPEGLGADLHFVCGKY